MYVYICILAVFFPHIFVCEFHNLFWCIVEDYGLDAFLVEACVELWKVYGLMVSISKIFIYVYNPFRQRLLIIPYSAKACVNFMEYFL